MKLKFLLMLFSRVTSDLDKEKEACTQPLIKLAPCLPYVRGNASEPTPDCCSNFTQVIKFSKKCLCLVIKERNEPYIYQGLNINVTLAFRLPGICNSSADPSDCPAILHLSPDSPDAQIFYPTGVNRTSNNAATSTTSNVHSPPANPEKASPSESSDGCQWKKRWFGVEAAVSLLVLCFLAS